MEIRFFVLFYGWENSFQHFDFIYVTGSCGIWYWESQGWEIRVCGNSGYDKTLYFVCHIKLVCLPK